MALRLMASHMSCLNYTAVARDGCTRHAQTVNAARQWTVRGLALRRCGTTSLLRAGPEQCRTRIRSMYLLRGATLRGSHLRPCGTSTRRRRCPASCRARVHRAYCTGSLYSESPEPEHKDQPTRYISSSRVLLVGVAYCGSSSQEVHANPKPIRTAERLLDIGISGYCLVL